MANSNDFDFMSIGKHCSQENCRQLDYLPFVCDFCRKDFCLEHKEPELHLCTEIVDKDSRIVKCPLCQQHIEKGVSGKDDNTQVELHIRSGCKEFVMTKRKKQRCSYDRCREVNLIPLHCEKCYRSFCVRHRHQADHNCTRQRNSRLVQAH